MEENKFSNEPPQYGQPPVNPINNQFGQNILPNSTAVLVLGILSIVFCFCYGVPGLILGIIAVALGSKGMTLYNANPSSYSQASFNNLKAGRICGIIGLILSVLTVICVVIYAIAVGTMISAMRPWDMH
jgi:magnesium-transporting ATPase (P-type)